MDRKKALSKNSLKFFEQINELHDELGTAFKKQFDRSLPLTEELIDRWERAKNLGFGEN